MKRSVLIVFFALMCLTSFGQMKVRVVRSDYSQTDFSFQLDDVQTGEVIIGGHRFATLSFDDCVGGGVVGAPDLPEMRNVLEIPVCSDIMVSLSNVQYDTVFASNWDIDAPIVPVQPSRSKSDTTAVRLELNNEIYGLDSFFGAPIVSVEKIGVARDKNLATIVISPISYNPVKKQLIVCKSAEVSVRYLNTDIAATQQIKQHGSGAFSLGMPLLAELPVEKSIALSGKVRMLIVCHSDFRGELDDFVQWKRRTGFMVDVAYTDSIGTTSSSIKDFIFSQYSGATAVNPAPTYLLLVGDHEQIPAFQNKDFSAGQSHVTDLYYATWTVGDNIPDCYYGRFSAKTVAQLRPQLEKTLMYERYEFPDPAFLDKAVLVAGIDQGYSSDHGFTHGDPTMDYAATYYVNGTNGFSQVKYYKNNIANDPDAANVTVASNRNTSAVKNSYNEGAGWINYTAHGDWNNWSMPTFDVSDVSNMNNANKFGFMLGNCCLTGKFEKDNCYGESLLRKDGYCGAVAYIGASNYTYWNEDVYWSMGYRPSISAQMPLVYNSSRMGAYDRLFHTHEESVDNQFVTVGGIMMAGNMSVQSTSSSLRKYYWEVYHLFGDPSLIPWLGQPKRAVVLYDNVIAQCGGAFHVTTSPGAYVAMTTGGEECRLVAAGFANDGGIATLCYPDTIALGEYELAVTGQHIQPSFHAIRVDAEGMKIMETKVYPMPAKDWVFVECDTTVQQVSVYDVMGRLMKQYGIDGKRIMIDVSDFQPGYYLLRLRTPSGVISDKIVKSVQ